MEKKVRVRIADFGIKFYDEMPGIDGMIFRAILSYKGKEFATVFDEGRGGEPHVDISRVTPTIEKAMTEVLTTIDRVARNYLGQSTTVLCSLYMNDYKPFFNKAAQLSYYILGIMELILEYNDGVVEGKSLRIGNKTFDCCTVINYSDSGLLSGDLTQFSPFMKVISIPAPMSHFNSFCLTTLEKEDKRALWCAEYHKDTKNIIRYGLGDIVKGIEVAGMLNKRLNSRKGAL